MNPAIVEEIALTWIQWLAWGTAIDSDFDRRLRAEIAGFDKPAWAHKGAFRKEIAEVLKLNGVESRPGRGRRFKRLSLVQFRGEGILPEA